jgi:ZIP family zinc transporter
MSNTNQSGDAATVERAESVDGRRSWATALGAGALVAFAAVLAVGYVTGRDTLLGIVSVGFLAMVAGVGLQRYGRLHTTRRRLWAGGLASGAMLASAAAFLAPKAIGQHPQVGGFAVAGGYLLGYAGHELGHLVGHRDLPVNATVSELTLHAAAAGTIMGVVYGSLPSLTSLFGYAVVAHKLPAGFGGAAALDRDGLPHVTMALPAAAVGLTAIPAALVTPALGPVVKAVLYGVSTGVFAHVALDMLPECSGGSDHGHGPVACGPAADRMRHHAVASTVTGTLAVFLAWLAVAA